MENTIETNIKDLMIKINKVVADERGFLAEMAPRGTDNTLFKSGIGNIYTSTATGKHTARAGHLHKKNIESFYTLSGTALWLFLDCRKDSPTFNKVFTVILGSSAPKFNVSDTVYTLDQLQMAQAIVPTGVYHIFWPLTEDPVIVVAIASEPYDKSDYEYRDLKSIPFIREKLNEYDIVIE